MASVVQNVDSAIQLLNNWGLMGEALINKRILSTSSLTKCMEISLENLFLDNGA